MKRKVLQRAAFYLVVSTIVLSVIACGVFGIGIVAVWALAAMVGHDNVWAFLGIVAGSGVLTLVAASSYKVAAEEVALEEGLNL